MKNAPLLVLACVILFTASGSAQQPSVPSTRPGTEQPQYKTKKLSRDEFDRLVAEPSRLLIIDVRRPDEVTSIGGYAVYLSIQAADIERQLAWIPRDRTIVTVSNHANRSGRVGDLLTSKGFNVAGTIGVQDYEAEGGTLKKIAPPKAGGR